MNNIKLETGCYIDGHWGVYGLTRLIEIAQDYGFEISDNDEAAIEAYRNVEEVFVADTGEEFNAFDWIPDIADDAEEYLNRAVAEDGYGFGWIDGEFFYMPLEWWEENDCTCLSFEDDDVRERFICKDCGYDTYADEYYMVHDLLWLIANKSLNMIDEEADGMLCVGCLEDRIGRRLVPEDFTDCPLNTEDRFNKSNRLRDRMGLGNQSFSFFPTHRTNKKLKTRALRGKKGRRKCC